MRHVVTALVVVMLGLPTSAGAQADASSDALVGRELARAERAFEDDDTATAEAAYAAVLAADPDNTRALYRLAHLRRRDPSAALALLERYVTLVPRDAWGHLALASALAEAGRPADALQAYDRALALEPDDRDIALGGPRLRARLGQTDRAIASYRAWLAAHADDGEAWREMADEMQRARRFGGALKATERALQVSPGDERLATRLRALRMRTAPAVEVGFLGIGETDVATVGGALGGDVMAGESARVGVVLAVRRLSSLGEVAETRRLLARGAFAPRADLHLQIVGGVVWSALDGSDAPARTRPEANVRFRRRPTTPGVAVDLRAQHGPVDATPQLAVDELVRTQLSAAIEAPLGWRVLARGSGRVALMSRTDEQNVGTRYGGGIAAAIAEAVHVSGQWHQSRYREPAIGYFAPRLTDTVEVGIDFDRERGAWSFALDAGAGIQRVQKYATASADPDGPAPPGPPSTRGRGNAGRGRGSVAPAPVEEPAPTWGPALRAWGLVSWAVRPGRLLGIEFETYDSQVADAVMAAEQWRYASVTVSFRLALR